MKWSKLPAIYQYLILSLDKKAQKEIELTWIGEENVFNFEKTNQGKEFWQSVFAAKSVSELPALKILKADDYDKLVAKSERTEFFKSENTRLDQFIIGRNEKVRSLEIEVDHLRKKLYKKEIELITIAQSSLDYVKIINQAPTINDKHFLTNNYIIVKTDQISKDIDEATNAKWYDDLPF